MFDEIEIPYGLIWLKSSARLIGSTFGVVAEKDIEQLNAIGDLHNHLGKKILQIFFMSSNGSVCLPLAFFLSTGTTSIWMHGIIVQCIEKLHQHGVVITWGCSDMFSGCVEYIQLVTASYPDYKHIFDCTHWVKLGRNYLLDRVLKNQDCEAGFSIWNLFTLWETNLECATEVEFR